jgi:hypothetical protein
MGVVRQSGVECNELRITRYQWKGLNLLFGIRQFDRIVYKKEIGNWLDTAMRNAGYADERERSFS